MSRKQTNISPSQKPQQRKNLMQNLLKDSIKDNDCKYNLIKSAYERTPHASISNIHLAPASGLNHKVIS